LPNSMVTLTYAKLDILGTIDQGCRTLQDSGSDGLTVSLIHAAERGHTEKVKCQVVRKTG